MYDLGQLIEESEKSVPKDLEEAARQYFENPENSWEVRDAFIAGAKWQKEQDQGTIKLSEINPFLAGVNYQKEQMMKNALHGWLDEDNEPPYDLNVHCEEKIPFGEFKHCDKVRIIIMKEDEK